MLTIIIPSYNHQQYITQCLEAACSVSIETKIMIIDDGSKDNSTAIINEFIRKSENPINLICKENSGLVSSLNLGLNLVKSKYVYFIASDDILNPDGILDCIKVLEENPAYHFCIGGGQSFKNDDTHKTRPIYTQQHENFFRMDGSFRKDEIFLNYPSPLLLQTVVFKTQALLDIGGWDTNLAWDDYPLFVKLLSMFPTESEDFIFAPNIDVVLYRQHESNTYKNIQKQFEMVKQSLLVLAPLKLRSRAIGYKLAYYLLTALRNRDFLLTCRLFFTTSPSVQYWALRKIPSIIFDKIWGPGRE